MQVVSKLGSSEPRTRFRGPHILIFIGQSENAGEKKRKSYFCNLSCIDRLKISDLHADMVLCIYLNPYEYLYCCDPEKY